jgi:quercetin dioxygenase-like cupin family protein
MWDAGSSPISLLASCRPRRSSWYLDTYPTRVDAEAALGPRSTVVESLGKVWLLTVETQGWRPAKGERLAAIGPLPVTAGEHYSAQYMEAILNPGMTSAIHTHPGPEARYTLAGETCLETPDGKLMGRAGEPLFVPGGPPDGTDGPRNDTAPCAGARAAPLLRTCHHPRPRLDPEGFVQALTGAVASSWPKTVSLSSTLAKICALPEN